MQSKRLSRIACVVVPLLVAACAAQPQPATSVQPQPVALADLACDELRTVLEGAEKRTDAKSRRDIMVRMLSASRRLSSGDSSHRPHGVHQTIASPHYIRSAAGGGPIARNRAMGLRREIAKRC